MTRSYVCMFLTVLVATPVQGAIEQQGAPAKPPATESKPTPTLTKAPELLQFSEATYPPELLAKGQAGEALLLIDIDAQGKVEAVQVTSSSAPEFGDAALTAATRFVFAPAEIDGKPSAIRIEYRYVFTPEAPPLAPPPPQTDAPEVEAPITLVGLVREAGNRRPIVGAVIEVDDTGIAETDANGRFEARGLVPGRHKVRAASASHRAYVLNAEVKEGEVTELRIYLVRKSGDPFETVVRTRKEHHEVSRVQLDRQEVQRVPGTFGDPVRVIENLPGMARVPGGLGGALLVRGTPPEDSAVYIDGVEVPLLYHFGGLTSVINAEFLDTIDFLPGGFGARYGRATAGVVDVKSREPSCDTLRGSGAVSFLLSEAYLCAPVGEWKLALAGRRSYIDLLLPPILDRIPREPGAGRFTVSPVYWDYQSKAQRDFGDHNVDIFAFGSDDKLRLILTGSAEDVNVKFGMQLTFHRLRLRDQWTINDRVTLTSTLSPGFERQTFVQSSDSGTGNDFGLDIYNADWREDLRVALTPELTLNAGLDHSFGRGLVDFSMPIATDLRSFPSNVFDYTESQSYEAKPADYSQGYWVEGVYSPTATLKLSGGVRFDRFDFDHTQGFALQPRASARYEMIKGTTVKAAYGVYAKLPSVEYLLPEIGNPGLEAERAQHFIAGIEHRFTPVIDLDVQGYYNKRYNLRSPTPAVTYADGKVTPLIWDNAGSGRSYGLEVLLRHLATTDGLFYGWIAYTLSRSLQRDRDTPVVTALAGSQTDLNDPTEEYVVSFDQTHILTVVGQWALPWGLDVGFRYRLTSGNPYTPLNKGTTYWDADMDAYVIDTSNIERRSERMPTFHQLDVRIDKTFTFDLWKLTPYLEILNAYNARNVEGYTYDYRYRQRTALTLLPIVPILGVRGEF